EGEQIRQVRRQPLFDLNVLLQIEDDHEVEVDPAQRFRVHMLAREVRLLAAQQFIALVPLGIALYQIEIARKRMREQYLQVIRFSTQQRGILAVEAAEDQALRQRIGQAQREQQQRGEQPEQAFAQSHAVRQS